MECGGERSVDSKVRTIEACVIYCRAGGWTCDVTNCRGERGGNRRGHDQETEPITDRNIEFGIFLSQNLKAPVGRNKMRDGDFTRLCEMK